MFKKRLSIEIFWWHDDNWQQRGLEKWLRANKYGGFGKETEIYEAVQEIFNLGNFF